MVRSSARLLGDAIAACRLEDALEVLDLLRLDVDDVVEDRQERIVARAAGRVSVGAIRGQSLESRLGLSVCW